MGRVPRSAIGLACIRLRRNSSAWIRELALSRSYELGARHEAVVPRCPYERDPSIRSPVFSSPVVQRSLHDAHSVGIPRRGRSLGASTGTCGHPNGSAISRRENLPDSVFLHFRRNRCGVNGGSEILRQARTTAAVDVLRARYARQVASRCSRQAELPLRDQPNRFLPEPRQGTDAIHHFALDEPLVNGLLDS